MCPLIGGGEREKGFFEAGAPDVEAAGGLVFAEQRADRAVRVGGEQDHALRLVNHPPHAGQRLKGGAAEPRPAAHLVAGGLLLDARRRTVGDHPSLVEHHDAIGERVGFLEVVRGQQDGAARAGEPADARPEAAARLDVHANGGLVEKEQHRIAADGEGEQHPLTFCRPKAARTADRPAPRVPPARGRRQAAAAPGSSSRRAARAHGP